MDRSEWLREKRRLAEERMDTLWAPIYDEEWGRTLDPTHRKMVRTFLTRFASPSLILDAACGTGKPWPLLLEAGHAVVGIDQSQAMLDVAHRKFPNVPLRKLGLQELDEREAYNGIICMDAMENVFPEDWPLVLRNFYRALRPSGHLYFTVELESPGAVADAFQRGRAMGLPLVEGEWAYEGGYHFYPSLAQVHVWVNDAGFTVEQDTEGDGYYHLIAWKPPRHP